jgi:hypothetical protein
MPPEWVLGLRQIANGRYDERSKPNHPGSTGRAKARTKSKATAGPSTPLRSAQDDSFVVGMSLIVVGMSLIVVGTSFSVVGMSLFVEGTSFLLDSGLKRNCVFWWCSCQGRHVRQS